MQNLFIRKQTRSYAILICKALTRPRFKESKGTKLILEFDIKPYRKKYSPRIFPTRVTLHVFLSFVNLEKVTISVFSLYFVGHILADLTNDVT